MHQHQTHHQPSRQPSRSRRALACGVLAVSPALFAGCSGAQVQQFFTSRGMPISEHLAEKIAHLINKVDEAAKPKPKHDHPKPPCTTTTTTTAAPTTTVAPVPTLKAGGCHS